MGREDLGTCVILSEEDVEKLNVDLSKLQNMGDMETPMFTGISFRSLNRRLRKHIESEARKSKADIAVITSQ